MEDLRISPKEILAILLDSRKIFSKEKILLEINTNNAIFVGDIHGDLVSATKLFRLYQNTDDILVFLGDYVDRGQYSVEVMIGLLRLKLENPDRIILLRGNHETTLANEHYGFLDELYFKYPDQASKLYDEFNRTFSEMPIACIINSSILCMHGGIPKDATLKDIASLKKGDITGLDPILLQVLWNDPDESIEYFAPSPRGQGIYLFGNKAFNDFMDNADLELLIRAHSYIPYGAKWFFKGRLLSLFSPTEYVGRTLQPKIAKLREDKIKIIDLEKL